MKFLRPSVIVGTLPVLLQNGTVADATQVMSDLNWIVNQVNANAADASLVALKASNNNFTVVQSGTAATASANFPIASQVQNMVFNTLSSTLGTNVLTARVAALPLSAYAIGQIFTFQPAQKNTTSVTIAIDALGSAVIKSNGNLLVGGELGSGAVAVRVSSISPMPVLDLINPTNKLRTITALTSGSGTYTTPSGCTAIKVRMVGGGGGGGGGGAAGSSGGNTTFANLTASGGGRNAGTPGTGTNGDVNISGGIGGPSSGAVGTNGNVGGGTPFGSGIGGGGINAGGGLSASANTGAGGGGGGGSTIGPSAAGGSGGGYVEKLLTPPASSYSYSVGAKGIGDTGSGATGSGGDGGSGIIIIDEFYN